MRVKTSTLCFGKFLVDDEGFTKSWSSKCDRIHLFCADWRNIINNENIKRVQSIITDPPYSERTAEGYKSCPDYDSRTPIGNQKGVEYGYITEEESKQIYEIGKNVRWMVVFGDHISSRWHEENSKQVNRYTFAPLPYIRKNAAPRFLSDGPQSCTDYIIASRIKKGFGKNAWKSLPGYYLAKSGSNGVTGAKDLQTMRKIILHYSNPGDTILDLYAGSGTTLLAAAMEGRCAIGVEKNEETYEKAIKILSTGYTPSLFCGEQKIKYDQGELV